MAVVGRRVQVAKEHVSDQESDSDSDGGESDNEIDVPCADQGSDDDDVSDNDQPSMGTSGKPRKLRDYNSEADQLGIDREYYIMEMCAYQGECALITKQRATNVLKTVVSAPAFESPIYGLPAKNSFSAYVPLSGLIPACIPHCASFTVRGQVWSVVPSCHMMLTPRTVHCTPCPLRLITNPVPTVGQYQQPAFPAACVYPSWVKNKYNQGWTPDPKLIVYDHAPWLNFPVLDIQKLPNVYISRDPRVRPLICRYNVAKLVFTSGTWSSTGQY